MKCACGYEHKSGVDDRGNWQDNLAGDEPFLRIEGSVFRIKTDERYSEYEDVSLHACPKCGTVRMEKRL